MSEQQQAFVTEHGGTRSSARQLTLRARLAISFGLIALLFAAANYLSQRHTRQVTEQIQQSTQIKNRVDRVARLLSDALATYQRALVAGVVSEKSMHPAHAALLHAATEYAALNDPLAASLPAATLTASINQLRSNVAALIAVTKQSEAQLNRYWSSFDQLHQTLATLEKTNWRIGDRVVTRLSSTSIVDALQNVRSTVGAYLAGPTGQRAAAIGVAEETFLSMLERNADTLSRTYGQPWLQTVHADFTRLRQQLRNVRAARDQVDRQAALAATDIQAFDQLIRSSISEPATQALAAAAVKASATAQQADRRVAYTSMVILALIVVIGLFTVASIAGPLTRMTRATHRLAAGDETTRAPRGGMRELDLLAAAFNDMADRLADANHVMRVDQARLEERVVERTRQLRHLAYHDTVTQLPNRRYLFQHLTTLLDQARGTHRRIALLLLDLDNFKTLNDSLGHLFGDRVLKAIGERLTGSIHRDGFAARLGGDEFTIVCQVDTESGDVVPQAEALLAEFQRPLQVDNREIIVSLSIGVGIFPDHALDAESLLRAADAALFKAKESGRNRMCVASPELVEQIGGQFKTEQALRRAAQHNELELLYQPQLNLQRGEVTAVEALLRWKRGGAYVAPLEFLPLAEQSGLIGEITDWVLKQAIVTLALWQQGPWPQARVAVNVSAQQLVDQGFVRKLQDLLALHRVSPASLELELTETVLQSGSTTAATLRELRQMGVGIALDDFGAGYSSLASLEQLDMSRVKIDRSLIENVDRQPRSAEIARSMIALCRSLNLDVTVEGIERPEQLRFLRTCASVDVQGFLFAIPLPADQVPTACRALPAQLLHLDTIADATHAKPTPTILQWRWPPRH